MNILQLAIDQLGGILEITEKTSGALKAGVDIHDSLKKVFGGKEPVGDLEAKRLIAELLGQLHQAQIANMTLQAQLAELLRVAKDANRMEGEFARYELWKAEAGGLVYRLRKDDGAGEPDHYICPSCKEGGKKTILQGHDESVECPLGHGWFRLRESRMPSVARVREGWDFFKD